MRVLLFVLLSGITPLLSAKDFGSIGETVPVKERNIIEFIQEKANILSQDEKDQIQEKIRQRYEKRLQNPSSLNLPETNYYSSHTIDCSITVNEDISDTKGNIIVKMGTKYNPLTNNKLSRNLLFFDGDDLDQVEWAKKAQGTWVLVKGKPLDLEESESVPVYFDQGGRLCKKFRIRSVPAKVSQKGSLLNVEFIPKGERF